MTRTVKNHLGEYHEAAAAHNDDCSKCFSKLAGMVKATDGGPSKQYQKLADLHADHADLHRSMADACEKATQADAMSKADEIRPDGVHGIMPSDVPRDQLRPRAITRVGQPSLVDKTEVPAEFAEFFKIE